MPRPAPRKQKFSDGFIQRLQPQAARAYAVWDTRQPGLAVVVQPSGHRAFKFVYSFKSRPRWYHIGNAAIAVADARKLAAGVMLKVIEGHDPAAEKKADASGQYVCGIGRGLCRTVRQKEKQSWPQADRLVRAYSLPRWGKLPANSITRADVKAMMSRIAAPWWPTRLWRPRGHLRVGESRRHFEGQPVHWWIATRPGTRTRFVGQ